MQMVTGRAMHNQHPLRRWCETRPVTICIHSRYQFEGKLPIGIQIANKLREGAKKIPDYLEFESELTLRPPAVESNVLAKKKEFVKVPVLRNLVPAQVLAGKSSFNSGNSISAGLPVYARNEVKAIAAILERK